LTAIQSFPFDLIIALYGHSDLTLPLADYEILIGFYEKNCSWSQNSPSLILQMWSCVILLL